MTMSQIEVNKKIRGEQEFEQMFFRGKKVQNSGQIVTRYDVLEAKMKETKQVKKEKEAKKKRIGVDYDKEESLIPGVS